MGNIDSRPGGCFDGLDFESWIQHSSVISKTDGMGSTTNCRSLLPLNGEADMLFGHRPGKRYHIRHFTSLSFSNGGCSSVSVRKKSLILEFDLIVC